MGGMGWETAQCRRACEDTRVTDTSEVGARIRRLRVASGLSQVEFATRLGVANGTVSMIENGSQTPSDELMERMAAVLDATPRFLLASVGIGSLERPWLRAYADASKREVDRQIADAVTATEFIEALRIRPIPDTIPIFDGDLADEDEIEQLALDVRAAAGLGEADVVGNSIRAAERLGCLVLPMSEELGRHLGMSVRASEIPVIRVSRASRDGSVGVPGDRQRFTVAHELGHLALHSGRPAPRSASEAGAIERQAHRFAGAFLAPADPLVADLEEQGGRITLRTLSVLKERWGIAIKALVMRFQAIGLVDAEQARSLHKQISARGWTQSEPVPVGPEHAIWLTRAIGRAPGSSSADSIDVASELSGLGNSYLTRWITWEPVTEQDLPASVVDLTLRPRRQSPLRQTAGSVAPLPVRRSPRD